LEAEVRVIGVVRGLRVVGDGWGEKGSEGGEGCVLRVVRARVVKVSAVARIGVGGDGGDGREVDRSGEVRVVGHVSSRRYGCTYSVVRGVLKVGE
jgi:hypothetical protein